ncbi:MAG: hypothetical protein K6G22_01285 [Lachnospiraceae bacterium]|nr:hypothetical protein [Lachnospiraceae bacterium]
MGNIISIIINFILFICAILSIAVYLGAKPGIKDPEAIRRFRIFTGAYTSTLLATIVVNYAVSGSYFGIIAIQFLWFSFVALLASIVSTLAYLLDEYDRLISWIVSGFCYFGLVTAVLEIVFGKYEIVKNASGTFLNSTFASIHMEWVYLLIIMAFVSISVWLLARYHYHHKKKREKRLFRLAFTAMLICFFVLFLEIILENLSVYYPIFRLFMLPCFLLFCYALTISRNDKIVRQDYNMYLSESERDPVYITDSDMHIVFENEAADVLNSMYSDDAKRRSISGIMEFDEENTKRLVNDIRYDEDIKLNAIHITSDKRFLITVKRVMDTTGGLLCSILLCSEEGAL